MSVRKLLSAAAVAYVAVQLSGCAVVAVADAAVTVGATAVKIGAKAVGAAVDLVTPSSDKKKDDK
jgi:P pilus assembly chaperone PapD